MRRPKKPSPYEKKAPKAPLSARRRWTSNLVILVGAGILLVTGVSQIVAYFQIQAAEAAFAEEMERYQATLTPEATATPGPTLPPDATPTAAPSQAPGTPTPTSAPKPTTDPSLGMKLLGTLKIPRMKLSVPVVEGTGKKELHYGVGHITSTALPGKPGNVCLAGHRRGVAAKPFVHLDWLKPGDEVAFFDGQTTLTYIVYDSFIVDAEDNWVLRPIEDVEYGMTLISCYYPVFGPTQRIIVRARLEGT